MQRRTEKRGCSQDCAVTTESRYHVRLIGKSASRAGGKDWKGEIFMHLRRNFWFEDKGDVFVIGMDMSDDQRSSTSQESTHLAYSIRDSVT